MRTFGIALGLCVLVCAARASDDGAREAFAWAQELYESASSLPEYADLDGNREAILEAEEAALRVIAKYGPDYPRLMLLGHCAMRTGDYGRAKAGFLAASTLRPSQREAAEDAAKAEEYRVAASALGKLQTGGRVVKEVVRISTPEGVNWAGVAMGQIEEPSSNADFELDVFKVSDNVNAKLLYSQNIDEIGRGYTLNALRLGQPKRTVVLLRGHSVLMDGTDTGHLVVLEIRDRKWQPTFQKRLNGPAWIIDWDDDGGWEIEVAEPLFWRSEQSWIDIYALRGNRWVGSDAKYPDAYANFPDALRSYLHHLTSDKPIKMYKCWLTSEATGRAEEILGQLGQALRYFRLARAYCFKDISFAASRQDGNESDLSRIEGRIREVKARMKPNYRRKV